jgi:structure-specific recognition protein 1
LTTQNSGQGDAKPKKPLSAYIFFSQEFREIIRQRFPFFNSAQIVKAVSFKWNSLKKEQRLPYEQIANEDKQRYDREFNEFKKGNF